MLTPWTLLRTSDAAFVLAVFASLAGYVAGMGLLVCLFWRRLTRPEHVRLLRMRLEDADRQVGWLLAQNDRLARQLVTGRVCADDRASSLLERVRAASELVPRAAKGAAKGAA